ncbi:hypothetical protein EVAR_61053_1 [Eumeta japonica]|uniref:Uncharacterized protein n=1 Tax=Eumeta variegata TaxID=151549 RepID=A0A4C1Z9T2_EUMVA|nr:hypothetical protein EVAR_61053_1 [Eumeta japonica]
MKREWVTRIFTQWTKCNSRSSYFMFVFCILRDLTGRISLVLTGRTCSEVFTNVTTVTNGKVDPCHIRFRRSPAPQKDKGKHIVSVSGARVARRRRPPIFRADDAAGVELPRPRLREAVIIKPVSLLALQEIPTDFNLSRHTR